MNSDRETLEGQLKDCEEQLRGLNSYAKELKARAAAHGTPEEHFGDDLRKAEHNIKYYEDEIGRIRGLIGDGPEVAAYVVYRDASGEWRWQLRAANQRVVATSGEGYQNREDCLHAITLVKNSKDAPVKERQ